MIAVIAAVCLQAPPPKEPAWSEPVGGLVGRVEMERRGEKGGTPKLVPYIILKNVTNTIGTVDVWLSSGNLELHLVDAKGQPIKVGPGAGPNGRNGFIPKSFWLLIPFDSSVRINAGLEGYFTREVGSLLMETDSGMLFLPKAYTREAYVAGTFTVNGAPIEARSMRWEGKIELPKVKVWDGKKVVAIN